MVDARKHYLGVLLHHYLTLKLFFGWDICEDEDDAAPLRRLMRFDSNVEVCPVHICAVFVLHQLTFLLFLHIFLFLAVAIIFLVTHSL